MSKLSSWLQASRIPSQSYIFFPILLGAGAHVYFQGSLSWPFLALSLLYGLFLQLYIVYANDWADAHIDGENKTYNIFSGGSRVIPEGKITRRSLGVAAILTVVLNLFLGIGLWIWGNRPLTLPLILLSFLLLWLYSFPPVKLSYRGGGEFLQTLGVGIVLPLMGFQMQIGNLEGFPWHWLAFIIPLDLAASLTTTLPDEPSDRGAKKMTFAARFGGTWVKRLIIFLNALGLVLFFLYNDLKWLNSLLMLLVPTTLLFLMLIYLKDSTPGSKKLTLFVTFAVALKVLWTGSFGLYLIFSP